MADELTETDNLAAKLRMTENKFINQWTGGDLDSFLSEQTKAHRELMARNKAQVLELQQTLEELKEKANSNKQAKDQRIAKMKQMKKELQSAQKEADNLLSDIETTKSSCEVESKEITSNEQLIQAQKEVTDARLNELQKSNDFFKSRLGLEFQKCSDDRLQIIFRCIDTQKPDKKYIFCVSIQHGKYIVSGCEPPIENLDSLVTKLNETNNFRSFIVTMRSRFRGKPK